MKLLLAIALFLVAGPALAQEIDWNFRLTALEARVSALERQAGIPRPYPDPARQAATVIPPGFHAHTRTDGTVIVHADTNLGDPVAHAGIAHPWVKTGFAGQAVYASGDVMAVPMSGYSRTRTVSATAAFGGGCPGGVCPAGAGGLLTTGPIRRFLRGW